MYVVASLTDDIVLCPESGELASKREVGVARKMHECSSSICTAQYTCCIADEVRNLDPLLRME